MKKIHKFFSKDLLHILGAVGIFVAFLISIAYKQVGIGALIAAWLIAIAIIGVAWITDIRKADLLKKRKDCFRKSYCSKKGSHKIPHEVPITLLMKM